VTRRARGNQAITLGHDYTLSTGCRTGSATRQSSSVVETHKRWPSVPAAALTCPPLTGDLFGLSESWWTSAPHGSGPKQWPAPGLQWIRDIPDGKGGLSPPRDPLLLQTRGEADRCATQGRCGSEPQRQVYVGRSGSTRRSRRGVSRWDGGCTQRDHHHRTTSFWAAAEKWSAYAPLAASPSGG